MLSTYSRILPPIEVDGHKVNIFPGEDPDVTLEEVQNEVRKALADADGRHGRLTAMTLPRS